MLHIIPFGKRCPRCTIVFPYPRLGFDRNCRQRDGWSPYCKTCKRATYTPTEATLDKGRARARISSERARREKPEVIKQRKADHYSENRDRLVKKQALYNEMNREQICARAQQRRSDDPDRYREQDHKKRAIRLQATGTHTTGDIAQRYAAQQGRCWWCKKKVGKKYHVDHIFALARGGTNGPENICISCPNCNQRKHAKSPLEFAGRLF